MWIGIGIGHRKCCWTYTCLSKVQVSHLPTLFNILLAVAAASKEKPYPCTTIYAWCHRINTADLDWHGSNYITWPRPSGPQGTDIATGVDYRGNRRHYPMCVIKIQESKIESRDQYKRTFVQASARNFCYTYPKFGSPTHVDMYTIIWNTRNNV